MLYNGKSEKCPAGKTLPAKGEMESCEGESLTPIATKKLPASHYPPRRGFPQPPVHIVLALYKKGKQVEHQHSTLIFLVVDVVCPHSSMFLMQWFPYCGVE